MVPGPVLPSALPRDKREGDEQPLSSQRRWRLNPISIHFGISKPCQHWPGTIIRTTQKCSAETPQSMEEHSCWPIQWSWPVPEVRRFCSEVCQYSLRELNFKYSLLEQDKIFCLNMLLSALSTTRRRGSTHRSAIRRPGKLSLWKLRLGWRSVPKMEVALSSGCMVQPVPENQPSRNPSQSYARGF